ncbi:MULTISPECIES: FAD-dependent oxidoreductase [unclassified Pseudoalteromonas]|uniref:FAD-dependent oxidoreductase n=1 Tax=unclassified Pseudoalteromonas TaxID=194690 RepID=UPI000CF74A2D|nr:MULTISPECIES: NAD(P)/FAD-dependent oxidoreductase [unclassified Pseudoalteromonas]
MKPNIAIIGGGIAGLAFAIYYKKLGGRVDIYERSPLSGREGLGFIMLENGVKAMAQLGLDEQAAKVGYPVELCNIVDDEGNLLIEETLKGSYGVTRKAFLDVLLNEIPAEWLHFDHQFSHFEWHQDGSAKLACFTNGEKIAADYFLGCDGGRSAVRAQIFPEAKRSDIKVKELVSIVNSPELVQLLENKFVKYKHLDGGLAVGMVPADEQSVVWFVQYDCERFDILDVSDSGKQHFAERLVGQWPDPIKALIKLTDFSQSHIWNTCYLLPLERFHKHNVVLLGDAAHALLPFTSQGVNSAIEDAIELAKIFESSVAGFDVTALEHFSVMRKSVVANYLNQGLALQQEFLAPHHHEQKIPFAF